jgi:hypothetical protein
MINQNPTYLNRIRVNLEDLVVSSTNRINPNHTSQNLIKHPNHTFQDLIKNPNHTYQNQMKLNIVRQIFLDQTDQDKLINNQE